MYLLRSPTALLLPVTWSEQRNTRVLGAELRGKCCKKSVAPELKGGSVPEEDLHPRGKTRDVPALDFHHVLEFHWDGVRKSISMKFHRGSCISLSFLALKKKAKEAGLENPPIPLHHWTKAGAAGIEAEECWQSCSCGVLFKYSDHQNKQHAGFIAFPTGILQGFSECKEVMCNESYMLLVCFIQKGKLRQ